jgi:hypothetical protein
MECWLRIHIPNPNSLLEILRLGWVLETYLCNKHCQEIQGHQTSVNAAQESSLIKGSHIPRHPSRHLKPSITVNPICIMFFLMRICTV